MASVYINRTPKLQTINLRSGVSLHAQPYTKYLLAPGDETSVEVLVKVKGKTGVIFDEAHIAGAIPVPEDVGKAALHAAKMAPIMAAQEKPRQARVTLEGASAPATN